MKLMPLALLLISLPVAADQFYRWVDGQGRVNYSDQPPPSSMANKATQKNYKGSVIEGGESYALFEENGVLNPEIGHRFWSEILAQGGARPAIESFKAFRGREPTIDALLRHNGMA